MPSSRGAAWALSQLRHLYHLLNDGLVGSQQTAAAGLLAPALRELESSLYGQTVGSAVVESPPPPVAPVAAGVAVAPGPPAIRLTILGQPYSKANRRILSVIAGKPRSIKSKEALAYEESVLKQIPPAARQRLEGPVRVTLRIFYKTERPDLDESLILDLLQDRYQVHQKMVAGKLVGERVLVQNGCYRDDRQVRERHVYHGIDKKNPRTEIEIVPMEKKS